MYEQFTPLIFVPIVGHTPSLLRKPFEAGHNYYLRLAANNHMTDPPAELIEEEGRELIKGACNKGTYSMTGDTVEQSLAKLQKGMTHAEVCQLFHLDSYFYWYLNLSNRHRVVEHHSNLVFEFQEDRLQNWTAH